ncbi:MAG: tyrosine-type recombinase/integrase [Sulfitobacter sp.]|nr:tyrosine-type recombinase/integrase [Sulfitobacter sp.]
MTYYITYPQIPSGKRVRKAAGRDKHVAQLQENEMYRRWEMFKAGLYNPLTDEADKAIDDHLKDFLIAIGDGAGRRHGKPSVEHMDSLEYRLRAALHWMQVNTLRDLRQEAMTEFLQDLQAGRVKDHNGKRISGIRRNNNRVSAKTRDGYGVMLRQFGQWLEDEDRVMRNPFRRFRRVKVAGRDETFVRRALDLAEVVKLAEAVPERACLYYVAATTGLRRNELRSLLWSDIRIQGEDVPHIDLPGFRDRVRVTKNGKPARIPLQPWVAELLLEHRTELHGPVFDMNARTAEMIRADAEYAGIPIEDDQGRVLDFHSLRASAATILLSQGVHPDDVQEVMRHSDIRTTIAHYRKSDLAKLARAVQVVEDPRRLG